MLLSILLNAIVLGITVYIVSDRDTKPNISLLLGLPIGLGILATVLTLYIDMFSLFFSFAITMFAVKWAFNMTPKESLITSAIWIAWQTIYSIAG